MEPLAEKIEESLGLLRRGGSDEARALALARLCEQGELRDREDRASGIRDAAVHLPLVVAHDPQTRNLRRQPVRLCLAVSLSNADEEQEARAYGGDRLSFDRDRGALDPLEYYSQGLEGLASAVAGLDLVPVPHALLGRVPAEKDYAPLALVREVEQADVQVFEDDAQLPDALDGELEVVRLDAVLGAHPPAAVRARGP